MNAIVEVPNKPQIQGTLEPDAQSLPHASRLDTDKKEAAAAEKVAAVSLNANDVYRALQSKASAFAQSLLGNFNAKRSTAETLYFGSKNGSLAVTIAGEKQGLWYDFQSGEGGNLLTLLQRERGLGFKEALKQASEWTNGAGVSIPARSNADEANISTPYSQKTASANKNFEYAVEFSESQKERIDYVSRIVQESLPCEGTLAERYLKEHRGIPNPSAVGFRFHPGVYEPETQKNHPALLAVATDRNRKVQAMQCIYLNAETANKLEVSVQKRTYGPLRGASVLVQQGSSVNIALAEGPETALSVAQDKTLTVYAVLGVSNFVHAPVPAYAVSILICADNDGPDSSTAKAIDKAVEILAVRGLAVHCIKPAAIGDDFNDVLKKEGSPAIEAMVQQAPLVKSALLLEQFTSQEQRPGAYEALWPVVEFKRALSQFQETAKNLTEDTIDLSTSFYHKAGKLAVMVEKEPWLLEILNRQGMRSEITRFATEYKEHVRWNLEAQKCAEQANSKNPIADYLDCSKQSENLKAPWNSPTMLEKAVWNNVKERMRQLALIIDREPRLAFEAKRQGIFEGVRNHSRQYQRAITAQTALERDRAIER